MAEHLTIEIDDTPTAASGKEETLKRPRNREQLRREPVRILEGIERIILSEGLLKEKLPCGKEGERLLCRCPTQARVV